jgi:hypothetical protein
MAASSGAPGLEAAAVLGDSIAASEADLSAVRALGGGGVRFLVASPDGSLTLSVRT